MVVTTGMIDALTSGVLDWEESNFNYVGVGSGTTPATASDTSLESEVLRKAATEKVRDDLAGTMTVSLFIGSTEANGNSLSEVGVFDAASGGNMFQRATFTAINKTSDIEVWIDIEFTNTVTG